MRNRENTELHKIGSYGQNYWWKHVIQILLILLYLVPFYVIVVLSLKPMTDHSSRLSLPATAYLENYVRAFQNGMWKPILNTTIITAAIVVIEVVLGCLAAYPLARNNTKFNNFVSNTFLGVMMIPSLSVLVGVYSVLSAIKGINTYWGIVLASVGFGLPLSVYMYTNFIRSIPKTLDEAAVIDGASAFQTFFKVILPQLKPVTVTVIILSGVRAWNEYMYSLYILQKKDMYTVTLWVSKYFSPSDATDFGGAAAVAVIGMLPIVLAYLFLQRYFIQGAVDSGIKE